jgi:hypothetical protein
MIIVIDKKATNNQIEQMLLQFSTYIKVVIDIDQEILAGGEDRHFDAEQLLLGRGSSQHSLWGGGIDWDSKVIDFNSIINLRPSYGNPSRDILDINVRKKFEYILKKFLL